MTEEGVCECILDTAALNQISKLSGNLRGACLNKMKKGQARLAALTWREYKRAYEDDVAIFDGAISNSIHLRENYKIMAASIADGMNSALSRGAHDDNVVLYTAAIAAVHDWQVVTSDAQKAAYKGMGVTVMTVEEWLATNP